MTRQAAADLARIVSRAEDTGFGAHAVHVRIGDDVAVRHFAPDVRRDIHSVAKGVCVLAVGMASDEGRFDVDEPVGTFLPELATGAGIESVTVRHLLAMTSGVDLPWTATQMSDTPDLAAAFLSRPTTGRTFQYANASAYTAMRALARVVGDVHDWLGPRLYEPLGIESPRWDRCPNGFIRAGEGLHLTIDELARVGRVIADDGCWAGERLVSPAWVRAMHADWTERDAAPGYRRYALAGWDGPGHAWRLHGAYGQLLLFIDDTVVTVTADDHFGADAFAANVVAIVGDRTR